MKHTRRTPQSATIAIAAILALSPAAVLAQDAATTTTPPPLDGPIVAPDPVAAPAATAPAPQVIVPDTVASPATVTTSSPVVQEVPVQQEEVVPPEAVAPAAPARAEPAPRAAQPVAEPAPEAPPAVEGPQTAEEAEPLTTGTVADGEMAIDTSPASALPSTDQAAEPTPGQGQDVVSMLGTAMFLLVILVLGLAALLLVRNSRRKARKAELVRPTVTKPVVPAFTVEEAAPASSRTVSPIAPRSAEPVAATGGAVALPREMPTTFEERDALLRRMIAAKPDRANPFTDRIARRRRARLILQSLGRTFENNEPWIDLSDYSQNWPALSRRRYAKAA